MFRLSVVLCCFLSLNAQLLPQEQHPAPEPYSFAFSSPNDDGTASSREETGDANGRITGSYTILGADGQQRRVEYVADENGFRANVITNEIGTESQNAADAQYISSAPTAAELTAQWEASGAGKARLRAPGPVGGQVLGGPGPVAIARPAIRSPINVQGGVGLVAAPIAPIGGGFAGVQAVGFNQGIKPAIQGPLLRPISRAARLPGPVVAPPPFAPAVGLPAPVGIGAIHGGGAGFTRAQAIAPFGSGFVGGGGQSYGVRLAPVGVNSHGFNQLGVGVAPLDVGGASFHQGGLPYAGLNYGNNYGNYPLNNGANLFLLPTGPFQTQLPQQVSGASTNVITQRIESDIKEEDYGRKSK